MSLGGLMQTVLLEHDLEQIKTAAKTPKEIEWSRLLENSCLMLLSAGRELLGSAAKGRGALDLTFDTLVVRPTLFHMLQIFGESLEALRNFQGTGRVVIEASERHIRTIEDAHSLLDKESKRIVDSIHEGMLERVRLYQKSSGSVEKRLMSFTKVNYATGEVEFGKQFLIETSGRVIMYFAMGLALKDQPTSEAAKIVYRKVLEFVEEELNRQVEELGLGQGPHLELSASELTQNEDEYEPFDDGVLEDLLEMYNEG